MWQISRIRSWGYKKSMPRKGLGFLPANSKPPLLPRAPASAEWPRNPPCTLPWPFSRGSLFRRQFCRVIVSVVMALTCFGQNAARKLFSAVRWKEFCGPSGISGSKASQVKTRFNFLLPEMQYETGDSNEGLFLEQLKPCVFQGKVNHKGT